MTWRLLLPLIARVVASAAQRTAGSCNAWMCVNATLDGGVVQYELTNLEEPLGWMAVGWGERMPHTHMVVVWPNSDGTTTLSQRYARGHIEPHLERTPPRVASVPAVETSWLGTTTLKFTAPLRNTTDLDSTEDPLALTPRIAAFSPYAPASADADAHLYAHTGKGQILLALGEPDDSDTPADDSDDADSPPKEELPAEESPAKTTPAYYPSSAGLLAIHGAFMLLAFGVLLPIGALVARLGRTQTRNWIVGHKALQAYAGAPAILLGLVAAAAGVSSRGAEHVHDRHQAFGVLLVTLYVVQAALGVYIRRQKKTTAHPRRNIMHVALGVCVVGMGLFQVRSGLHEWDSHMPETLLPGWAYDAHGLWAAVCVIIYLLGLFLLRRQFAQEQAMFGRSRDAHDEEDIVLSDNTGYNEASRSPTLVEEGAHGGQGAYKDDGRRDSTKGRDEVHEPLLGRR
ncbi:hypothetical protein BD626DRAFT_509265 [Schizophyllum amplum]|uniref:Cytochrome b561 domain-containing protein n=1 Tax=Schizophyllum amplum TaxID=97359 RepID=A0A550C356_9AGAR|nr:hypothetical protein BD626DRAFT_509265 [Auriculariopsis ampla]